MKGYRPKGLFYDNPQSNYFIISMRLLCILLVSLYLLKYSIMETDNKATILLIYTGGTIGMLENPQTGALDRNARKSSDRSARTA